jgi:hypothetical protein
MSPDTLPWASRASMTKRGELVRVGHGIYQPTAPTHSASPSTPTRPSRRCSQTSPTSSLVGAYALRVDRTAASDRLPANAIGECDVDGRGIGGIAVLGYPARIHELPHRSLCNGARRRIARD